jgi:hypothetical protein
MGYWGTIGRLVCHVEVQAIGAVEYGTRRGWGVSAGRRGGGRPAVAKVLEGGIEGLPDGFSFHDLRHYLASLLIASGADIKTVRARMRHASARTTLDTYGHLWPEADESTRAAVDVVIKARLAGAETSCGPTAVPDP